MFFEHAVYSENKSVESLCSVLGLGNLLHCNHYSTVERVALCVVYNNYIKSGESVIHTQCLLRLQHTKLKRLMFCLTLVVAKTYQIYQYYPSMGEQFQINSKCNSPQTTR